MLKANTLSTSTSISVNLEIKVFFHPKEFVSTIYGHAGAKLITKFFSSAEYKLYKQYLVWYIIRSNICQQALQSKLEGSP